MEKVLHRAAEQPGAPEREQDGGKVVASLHGYDGLACHADPLGHLLLREAGKGSVALQVVADSCIFHNLNVWKTLHKDKIIIHGGICGLARDDIGRRAHAKSQSREGEIREEEGRKDNEDWNISL
jgi:hypothetical protein